MALALYDKARSGLRNGFGWKERRQTDLVDPRNVDSEISPADRKKQEREKSEAERDVVELWMKRYKEASAARSKHEEEWLICMSFYHGNQWVEWDTNLRQLVSNRDPKDPYRTYLTVPLIHPLVQKNIARATSTKPDVSIKPITDAPINLQAAEEGRLTLSHDAHAHNTQALLAEGIDWAMVTGQGYRKLYWDANKRVSIPLLGPGGQVMGVLPNVRRGDLCNENVPPYRIYGDPKAPTPFEWSWVIDANLMPLSEIQERWKEKGKLVKAGAEDTTTNYFESRLAGIYQDSGRGTSYTTRGEKNSAVVYECWEAPSERFPDGRVCWIADGMVLESGDLEPHDRKIPIIPLPYRKTLGSPYARV